MSETYGFALMTVSTLFFTGNALLTRLAETKYALPPQNAIFLSATVQLLLATAYLVFLTDYQNHLTSLSNRQVQMLVVRGVFGAAATATYIVAFAHAPAADVTTIIFLNPILAMLFARILIGELVTSLHVAAAFVSFVGAVLVARPRALLMADPNATAALPGLIWALFSAVLSGLSMTVVRWLGSSIHFIISVLSLSISTTVLSIFLGGFFNPFAALGEGILFMALAAVATFGGQLMINAALQHCRAGPGLLIRNVDVPLVYILGVFVLHETPTILKGVGAALVVGAAVAVGISNLNS